MVRSRQGISEVESVKLWISTFLAFDVGPDVVAGCGALDISVVPDLPLFIDQFLLFNSKMRTYLRSLLAVDSLPHPKE